VTRRAPLAVATLLAVGLAACGSANNSGTTTNASSQLALAQCMRSHGVANFPDPNTGGGFSVNGSPDNSTMTIDGTTFGGPTFEAAVKTCQLFGVGTAPPPLSASQKKNALAFAQCMRTHGVPSFPDPTFPAGGGIAVKVPNGLDRSSPTFTQARKACGERR
jgi:hypothetical protein